MDQDLIYITPNNNNTRPKSVHKKKTLSCHNAWLLLCFQNHIPISHKHTIVPLNALHQALILKPTKTTLIAPKDQTFTLDMP